MLHNQFNIWEIFSGLGTMVAAFAALYSAEASEKSARESKRAAEAAFMPIVEPTLLYPHTINKKDYYQLTLTNSGPGLALNIKVKIPLLDLEADILSLKPEVSIYISSSEKDDFALWKELKSEGLRFDIEYTDIFGNNIITHAVGDIEHHHNQMDFNYTVSYSDAQNPASLRY